MVPSDSECVLRHDRVRTYDSPKRGQSRPNDTATTGRPVLAGSTTDVSEPSQLVVLEADAPDDELDTIVAAVTTIAQSWCEHATNYADIEMLVCQLPIEQ